MLTACPECGTQVTAGELCPLCGTPTPAPAPPPPPKPGAKPRAATSSTTRFTNQWEAILEKIRRVTAPRYQIRGIIGFGGMAGVYLADEQRLGRQVAIKVMSPGLMVDPKLVERFEQEARTIAQFSHPNIVTIYEVDEREELHYFAMTYVPGRTLGQAMSEATEPLPIPVIKAWLYQIGDGLAYAHHNGVVHRDVKPGNVLLDLRGNALVTDFGIAKVADTDSGLTRTGMLVGTPAYMSPEQCSSGRITGASDQYSLGAVAYQMLTGQPPFLGATLSVLQSHVHAQPVPLAERRPDCPDDLREAVERMLAKQPDDRWPSMHAAITAAGCSPPGLDGPVREQLAELATPAAGISVAPWFDAVREGSRERLGVRVVSSEGRVLPNRRVDWTTGDELVAQVVDGVLLATCSGTTAVTAASGPARTTLNLTVEPDPVPSIEVEPTQVTVAVNGRFALDSIVHDWDGERLGDRIVLWGSVDPSVARVSADGVVTGVRTGTTTINASTGGKSASVSVTVTSEVAASTSTPATPAATWGAKQPTTGGTGGHPGKPRIPTDPDSTLVPDLAIQSGHDDQGAEARPEPSGKGRLIAVAAFIVVAVASGVLAIAQPWKRGSTSTPGDSLIPLPSGPVAGAGRDTANPVVTQVTPPGATGAVQEPPAPTTGQVRLGGNLPPGVRIVARDANGRTRNISGSAAELEPGTYTFEFSAAGWTIPSRRVSVVAGQTASVLVQAERVAESAPNNPGPPPVTTPPAPTTGLVEIAGSLPGGTAIVVREGNGPARPLNGRSVELRPGTYTFEFTQAGYTIPSQRVVVTAGDTARIVPSATRIAQSPPESTRTTTPPANNPPARDVRADQSEIENAVRSYVDAFNRKDAAVVVPLLPAATRDAWRLLLQRRDVSDFTAKLANLQTPDVNADNATVNFAVQLSFKSQNVTQTPVLRFVGDATRAGSSWRLVALKPAQ
jgi:Protein kinase domain/Bacterial Ig-like domain (group 2)